MGRLVLVTPATSRLITLDQAKLHCRCQHEAENDLFVGWIKSAEAYCQSYTSMALLTSTWRWIGSEFPTLDDEDAPIDLLIGPVQSISSVSYVDRNAVDQVLATDEYQLENGLVPKLYPGVDDTWPATQAGNVSAVTVQMIAGYTDANLVPAQFSQAILLIVGAHYMNRENPEIPQAANRLLDQVIAERYV
jgi:uncharacterized phiE125 gp8 family phage protein